MTLTIAISPSMSRTLHIRHKPIIAGLSMW